MFSGRVVRPGIDPYWTNEDQDKAIAWQREQTKLCPNCRTRQDLWAGSDHEHPPYIGQQHHCPGCDALEQEQKNIPEQARHSVTAFLVPAHLAEDPDPDGK